MLQLEMLGLSSVPVSDLSFVFEKVESGYKYVRRTSVVWTQPDSSNNREKSVPESAPNLKAISPHGSTGEKVNLEGQRYSNCKPVNG